MPGCRRHAPVALALALSAALLAGCHGSGRQEAATAAPGSVARSVAADYRDCRDRAGGDARELVACADVAVAAASPPTAGPAFATLGEAARAETGDDLAQQVAAADALAHFAIERATVREGAPLAAADERAVPGPLARAAAPIVGATCVGAAAAKACERGRARLLPRLAARLAALAAPAPGPRAEAAQLGGYVPPTCDAVRAASPDAALAQFESEFPAALKDERLVETIAIGDDRLRAISAYLACLAERTGFAPDVIDSTLTLFASRENGARARAALDRLGKGSGADAAAARDFASQVADYLADG